MALAMGFCLFADEAVFFLLVSDMTVRHNMCPPDSSIGGSFVKNITVECISCHAIKLDDNSLTKVEPI